ncbi:DUF4214 domain-containing protein [Thiorhodococcus minor]|uniref:DUF4214 domain-containing protein n=1 Tax=Thiorhodococcus minor TaxID=57489 RepID=A0A6M0K8H0_9GAMM|nr:DUF4214 domain-containing protein [Thiorhodococcus minor]NEV65313.1 DUF4214 domain-containing protein [Thiorhodococcus minor]
MGNNHKPWPLPYMAMFVVLSFLILVNAQNSNAQAFPIQDQIEFDYQSLDEIFMLSDGSMWLLKGTSENNLPGSTKSFTIYSGTDDIPNPDYGIKTDYFMLVEDSSSTFFVEPLPQQTELLSDRIEFDYQSLDEIFMLSDGSMWLLKGTSENNLPGSTKSFTIYSGTDDIPNPDYGIKTDYFMLVEDSSSTFFVEPLPQQTELLSDRIEFDYQSLEEIFMLSDGSMWLLKGTSENNLPGSTKSFTIYSGTDDIPNPDYGIRTDYFMLVEDSSSTFFVDALLKQDLTVIVAGNASSTVTSVPSGIDCGTDCDASFPRGINVTLTANPGLYSVFAGWSGACSGEVIICELQMSQPNTVEATFELVPLDRSGFDWRVTEIYIATMGYAPDVEGLQYWVDQMENSSGWTPTTVAQSFFDQELVKQQYPDDLGYEPLIEALYENIFGRPADDAGKSYWLTELQAGRVPRNAMIIALIEGGWANEDAVTDMVRFRYRVEVGLAFADAQVERGIVYSQLSTAEQSMLRQIGRDLIAGVTAEMATRDEAISSISGFLDQL